MSLNRYIFLKIIDSLKLNCFDGTVRSETDKLMQVTDITPLLQFKGTLHSKLTLGFF